jgi:hypothetical protein
LNNFLPCKKTKLKKLKTKKLKIFRNRRFN